MKVDKFIKLKLVKIWEILSQETDEEHPMSTQELLDKLAEMGIPCDRRTVYGDIKALNECGYEICCRRAISNEYYVKNVTVVDVFSADNFDSVNAQLVYLH